MMVRAKRRLKKKKHTQKVRLSPCGTAPSPAAPLTTTTRRRQLWTVGGRKVAALDLEAEQEVAAQRELEAVRRRSNAGGALHLSRQLRRHAEGRVVARHRMAEDKARKLANCRLRLRTAKRQKWRVMSVWSKALSVVCAAPATDLSVARVAAELDALEDWNRQSGAAQQKQARMEMKHLRKVRRAEYWNRTLPKILVSGKTRLLLINEGVIAGADGLVRKRAPPKPEPVKSSVSFRLPPGVTGMVADEASVSSLDTFTKEAVADEGSMSVYGSLSVSNSAASVGVVEETEAIRRS